MLDANGGGNFCRLRQNDASIAAMCPPVCRERLCPKNENALGRSGYCAELDIAQIRQVSIWIESSNVDEPGTCAFDHLADGDSLRIFFVEAVAARITWSAAAPPHIFQQGTCNTRQMQRSDMPVKSPAYPGLSLRLHAYSDDDATRMIARPPRWRRQQRRLTPCISAKQPFYFFSCC